MKKKPNPVARALAASVVAVTLSGCMTAEHAMRREKAQMATDHQTCLAEAGAAYDWCRNSLVRNRDQIRQRKRAAINGLADAMQDMSDYYARQNEIAELKRRNCTITGYGNVATVNCW